MLLLCRLLRSANENQVTDGVLLLAMRATGCGDEPTSSALYAA